jgi:hypothetical protein
MVSRSQIETFYRSSETEAPAIGAREADAPEADAPEADAPQTSES